MTSTPHSPLCVRLPIADYSDLQLSVTSEDDNQSDELRVASILRSSWNRMSASEQFQIFTHYRTLGPPDPQLHILTKWWWEPETDAHVNHRGREINLNWMNVCHAPDHILEILFAHELAHVLQHATGRDLLSLRKEDLQGRIELIEGLPLGPVNLAEIHADETIIGWGYQPLEYLIWMAKHMEGKDGKPRLRRRPLSDKVAERRATKLQIHAYYRKYS